MHKLADTLRGLYPERFLENEPMSRHTTFRVGGPAEMMFFPASAQELIEAMNLAREVGVQTCVVGNGSNLLVADGGLKGLVIVLGEHFSEVRVEGTKLHAQAGVLLSKTAAVAQEAGLSGLEFASGIPGTLGGGCAMNAGAYGGQMSDVLESAEVLLGGEVKTLSREELQMGYRTTLPLREGGIVLSATFRLREDDKEAIHERMRDLNARRRDKQPLNMPSAGSTFKRPEGHFAGALIEGCGLKGCTIGGAQVSEKHAGFVVNTGSASARDIMDLIAHIQRVVKQETGVDLEPEVKMMGEG
ncbi:MAG: UDP-N-acetylmuramate dehydrogenase [Clostridia bacterium]|nr:UDP-N-acetylmuramate dehydrogenase [Clostridia bacterium]